MVNKLKKYFENYIIKEPLFLKKEALQSTYDPENIPHRDKEIGLAASILAPALKLDKPSNLFIYGKTGTGKTLVINHVTKQIEEIAQERNIKIRIIYINCKLKKVSDTEYRLIAHICRELGRTIPATGLPTDEIYRIFFETIEKENLLYIIVLDEIDQLVKKIGDGILYNFTRINSELTESRVTIIGISNDMMFIDNLDPRIKSSLSEEEIFFRSYDAIQLQSILLERSKIAFKDGIIKEGVIEKCAAYSARDHGDARRALELLRVAGEVAEREESKFIEIEHIDNAEDKIEKDRILDIVESQPKQYLAVIYSIFQMLKIKSMHKEKLYTGEVYEFYKDKLCRRIKLRPNTQRRISDIITELDMLGIINAKLISNGRHGRSKEISHSLTSYTVDKIKKIIESKLEIIKNAQ